MEPVIILRKKILIFLVHIYNDLSYKKIIITKQSIENGKRKGQKRK
jgi:hypothetical protein